MIAAEAAIAASGQQPPPHPPHVAVIANMVDRAELPPTGEVLDALRCKFRNVLVDGQSLFQEHDFSFFHGSGRDTESTLAAAAVRSVVVREYAKLGWTQGEAHRVIGSGGEEDTEANDQQNVGQAPQGDLPSRRHNEWYRRCHVTGCAVM
jgi:hypothetical protein